MPQLRCLAYGDMGYKRCRRAAAYFRLCGMGHRGNKGFGTCSWNEFEIRSHLFVVGMAFQQVFTVWKVWQQAEQGFLKTAISPKPEMGA